MYLPDYIDLHNRHLAEQERELERRPRCYECDEPIQEDYCFEINEELVCIHCLKSYYMKSTDYYLK